ncbi:MAG TPA: type II toxin-antitoxin system RelE/ParE family toxin [Gemmatimonadaceae bacterium]|jgi:mRNA-degrading endonuclease RelE of RelBE toxin-antitoxin system
MSSERPLPGFVRLGVFERATKGLLSEEEQRELEKVLIEDPELGDRISGAGGVRKLRFATGGRGKSGGVRVIYYYRSNVGRIYLITAYPKNVKGGVTKAEKNQMAKLTAILDGE